MSTRPSKDDALSKSAADLEWNGVLEHLARCCHTKAGADAARSIELLTDTAEIHRLLDLLAEARHLHETDTPPPFGSVADLSEPLRRLDKEGILDGDALRLVATTLQSVAELARFLRRNRDAAPHLASLADGICDLQQICTPILAAFEPNGQLADHASPKLGSLRRRVLEIHDELVVQIKQLMETPAISRFLQDQFYTQRQDRFVLPVRADAGPAVDGIVLGSSSTGATVFVEPKQIVQLNNRLKVAKLEVDRETIRILRELSDLIAKELVTICPNLEKLTELDLIDARAQLAIRMQASPARVAADGRLQLLRMRHPLMSLTGIEVIASNVQMDRGSALLISGPNAGGKTVCLKAIGLCALMLRAGFQLPVAPDSHLPIYARVLADIGDDQSLERNLSTFSGHLRYLLDYLELSDRNTLVLLDEVVAGTDPGEGAALAQSLLEAFVDRVAHLAVTTHYERLKSLPLADSRFVNASVGYDLQRLRPTFELHLGTPGGSFALSVARQLGMDPQLASRAEALIGEQDAQVSRLLQELTEERTRLVEQKRAADGAANAARQCEQDYRHKLQQLRERGKREIEREQATAMEELKQLRLQLRNLRDRVKKVSNPQQFREVSKQGDEVARQLRRQTPPTQPPRGRPAAAGELIPGTRVWVRRLGGIAEIAGPPQRGKVTVLCGGMHSTVNVEDVLLPHPSRREPNRSPPEPSRPPAAAPAETGGEAKPPHMQFDGEPHVERTIDNTLDLRGMHVEEALRTTDSYLDQAMLRGLGVVFVLHGHGSGALRGAIRAHVQLSPAVERMRPGHTEEGGDALTVLWLR